MSSVLEANNTIKLNKKIVAVGGVDPCKKLWPAFTKSVPNRDPGVVAAQRVLHTDFLSTPWYIAFIFSW